MALYNREILKRHLNDHAMTERDVLDIRNRAIGKTISAIFSALGDSYYCPNSWIWVDDPDCINAVRAKTLRATVETVLEKLNIEDHIQTRVCGYGVEIYNNMNVEL